MKKVYNAPKAEKLVIETKDIITASYMLGFSREGKYEELSSIKWEDFGRD